MTRRLILAVFVASLLRITAHAETTSTGTVLSASGEPVEGAEVVVSTPQRPAFPNLAPEERDDALHGTVATLTDKAGKFKIAVPDVVCVLSVAHPKWGYAQVKPQALAETPDPVKLEPWCRIEGTIKIGAKPAPAGTKVTLGVFYGNPDAAVVHYGYDTATDAQGRYAFGNVPAGLNQIKVKLSPTGSPLEQYVAEPGKTVRFDIGGKGRPVVGKVVLPGWDVKELSHPDPKQRKLTSQSHFRRDVPWPKPPYWNEGATSQEREDILAAWRRTPEAVEQWKDQYRYSIEFQPDGSFRFDDVPPGKYFLTFTVYLRGVGSPNMIAQQRVEVTVPETPAVPTDEPLDLGEQRFDTKGPADADGL